MENIPSDAQIWESNLIGGGRKEKEEYPHLLHLCIDRAATDVIHLNTIPVIQ